MARPRLVPGDQIKVRSGIEPHCVAGRTYTIAKVSGGRPDYPDKIYFTERHCGEVECHNCNGGWMWDTYLFSKIKPDIKPGDTVICNSGEISVHLEKGGKYVVKGVLSRRDESGRQIFTVEGCKKTQAGLMCSCSDGTRQWTLNDDFDVYEIYQPITLEEANRAQNMPSIDDVAGFFGLKS